MVVVVVVVVVDDVVVVLAVVVGNVPEDSEVSVGEHAVTARTTSASINRIPRGSI